MYAAYNEEQEVQKTRINNRHVGVGLGQFEIPPGSVLQRGKRRLFCPRPLVTILRQPPSTQPDSQHTGFPAERSNLRSWTRQSGSYGGWCELFLHHGKCSVPAVRVNYNMRNNNCAKGTGLKKQAKYTKSLLLRS
ncbi:hypothetical protein BDDG_07909 [Blastomyces dermatitidis ATCC 18188]|uniref:Uncharacterized protein n=1 Tax=Ajellomyces dermatitidis (strain ATCC 18188 / CBS 674.68) TaxID=653446 RepID=F2TP01_AJEDA|nr:hypothetical protein BDDG_07909 [Blastomyces dermatitidis ATCC 18188]